MTKRIAIFLTSVLLSLSPTFLPAQANSWTNATSGNWQDSSWSLGILPGTNQDILLTNDGWKAVAINPNTAQNFPETMTVNSITISSPSNSYNTLLLNYAGTETPLTAQSISVESNSTMTMLSSALFLNGPNGTTMQVGGEFNQTNSLVSGRQVNVGYIGPGVYNLDSGMVDVSNLWVGGGFYGIFNQTGGTNNSGILQLEGTYNLSGGDFNATAYFDYYGALFHQTGGNINVPVSIAGGLYWLDGGFNYGGAFPAGGDALQTGGTNFGSLGIASGGSYGYFTMSNGVSYAATISVGAEGAYAQWDGTQVAGSVGLTSGYVFRDDFRRGSFALHGGFLSVGGMSLAGGYWQDGGTNNAGTIQVLNTAPGISIGLGLGGGLLTADNISVSLGGLQQTGGCLIVTNLTANGEGPWTMTWYGPDINLLGGQLIVSNIDVEMDNFGISGTTVTQTGTLTLGSSVLWTGPGTYTFGALIPNNGVIVLGTNVNCQIHFADSSSQSWSNAFLSIRNWSGSVYGGGSQQIFFGSNSAALTPRQLSQILIDAPPGTPPHPPNGLPQEVYFARILPTGEIVPDTGAPLPLQMQISGSLSNGTMPLCIEGDIGRNYSIEVSTDLINWTWWTNQSDSTGTISISDCEATNFPQRFYRVRVLP